MSYQTVDSGAVSLSILGLCGPIIIRSQCFTLCYYGRGAQLLCQHNMLDLIDILSPALPVFM